jgi:RNA polymerase sigma-32 factor
MAARRPKKRPTQPAAPLECADVPAVEGEAEEPEADVSPEEAAEQGEEVAAVVSEGDAAATDEDGGEERNRGALVAYDPLQRYLTEIRRYPLLSREEEKALAIRYKEHDEIEAAYKLVTGNLRLVVMIAREYQRATRNLLDLIQEGNIGLMEAVKKFDPYRGIRFPS